MRVIIRAVRRVPTVLIIALLSACGPKSGPKPPPAADVGAYPALKWVPGDATYAFVGTRVDASIAAAHDLFEAVSIAGGFDVDQVEHEIKDQMGFDPLSVDDLTDAGLDMGAGGVLFGQGFSPTFVFRLADPDAMQRRINAQRERVGNTIGVAVHDNIEVFTDLGNSNVHTAWAVDGGWMWVHYELVDEHEKEAAWFDASRAAGGAIAKDPDFTWALAQAKARQPDAPLFGLIKVHTMAARLAQMAREPEAANCLALFTPPRAAVMIGTAAGVSEGYVILDTAGGGKAIGAATVEIPSGWAAARAPAAFCVEWNLDAATATDYIRACDDDPARFVQQFGVRAGRAFLAKLDADKLEGVGAVSAEITNRRAIDGMIDIPGRSMFEKKQKYGPLDGKRFSSPMFPAVDYILDDTVAMAAVGDGVLASVVGDGKTVAPSVLAALDIRPHQLDDQAWNLILEQVFGVAREGARAEAIRKIKRWKRGTFELTLDGDYLQLHARGERP